MSSAAAQRPPGVSFLAVSVAEPALVAASTLLGGLAAAVPEVRWTRADTLHLTVAFLAGLDPAAHPAVVEAIAPVAAAAAPFDVGLRGLGAFPSSAAARVLWIGVDTGTPELTALAVGCRDALAAAGLPFEARPYRPHCTLGRPRARWSAAQSAALRAIPAPVLPRFAASELSLFESRPAPGGAVHSRVESLPLGRMTAAAAPPTNAGRQRLAPGPRR